MYRTSRNTSRALAGLAITGVLGLGGVGLANAASDDETLPTLTAVDDTSSDTSTDTTDDTSTDTTGETSAADPTPADRGGRGPGGRGGCQDGDAAGTAPTAPADAPVTVEQDAPTTVAPQPEVEPTVETGDL